MSNTLKRSQIGYNGEGADGRSVVHYQWEPFGWGCSLRCMAPAKCWAERMAPRAAAGMKPSCEDCRTFTPHFHAERLEQPARTKRHSVVLMGFHTDWMCPEHPDHRIGLVGAAMRDNPWHTFVTLTKGVRRLYGMASHSYPNIYLGATIRNQADASFKLDPLCRLPGKKWISYEPAWESVKWDFPTDEFATKPEGIIIGHDNRRGAPGTDMLEHIHDCVEQCKGAGVNWWVKQIWVAGCLSARCGIMPLWQTVDDRCCRCGNHVTVKLLRASHPDEYALFPEDLKGGRLPWSAPQWSPLMDSPTETLATTHAATQEEMAP